ncbi:MAG: pantoate--beta-alanine ligase [Verrucomicrobia bacterium]|nr:pantoate--beta-alanine ligase [Verrucomicrobiota bacterium]MDA1088093.1 pantoate--beta-alanine ligase [Verrucomicrobiota bacterium]
MQIVESPSEMQSYALGFRSGGRSIALVPTMGFLHAAHLSLLRLARERADIVVVSVFVNPTQFGPGEDFDNYPRAFERDAEVCRKAGADILFHPSADTMYANDHSVVVEETSLSRTLCGLSRPEHFAGVTTVVAKLFNIVQPHVAVFGAKDAQQARVIQRMTRDLNFPIEIIVAPTVREEDGLAMSSRNALLTPPQRAEASRIRQALLSAKALIDQGERDPEIIRRHVLGHLNESPELEIDYVDIVDGERLRPVERIDALTLIAVAVRIGDTRLIDNIMPACDAFPDSSRQSST